MERKISQDIKRKVARMRRKYFEDIASDHYIKTGIPLQIAERLEQAEQVDIPKLLKQNKKNTQKAIKNAKAARRRRKTKKEDQLIFI